MSKKIRLSDYVVDFVANQSVDHIFLVPGGGAMYLNDALAQSERVAFVPNHHEQASSIAAEAYARINGHLGVAMLTTGPGGTNGITGVAGAWIESVPLLIISGQVKRADLMGESGVRQKGPQEVDIVSIVKPITKYAVTVMEPTSIRYELEKAVHLATTGRRGPVWVDIPLDVQASQIDVEALSGFAADAPASSAKLDEAIRRVADLIGAAQRPLILAGHGVRLAGAAEAFKSLYDKLQIPVVTTWNAMDLIPSNHPLSVGHPGVVAQRPPNFAVQNSDLLITIGARLDNVVTAFNPAKFGREAKKVIVDIDQNELAKFSMPVEEAICSDALTFIEKLSACKIAPSDRSRWLERCTEWKRRYPPGDNAALPESGPISHLNLMRVFSDELPENSLIVTGSSGLAVEFFYSSFQNKPGQRVFLTSGLGAMGYGLPAIIGAGMALGGAQPYIGIESDGSFLFNVQELATIRELNLPVLIFIMNNNGYASIRATQRNYFQSRFIGTGPEARLHLPDLVQLASVFGIPGMQINDISELREKMQQALSMPRPFICDVRLIPDEALFPKCSALPQPDGSMKSMPLEDMMPLLTRAELRENMLIPLDPVSESVEV
ncbi:MAG: thiamine pyrophosphate-binding protein [Candidatus Obscuribacterales bacterium]